MFRIVFQPLALEQLRARRRTYQVAILDAVETHLTHQPTRVSRSRIKRLRFKQDATYRLSVGEYRIFYDVEGNEVRIVQVLLKTETEKFYKGGEA